MSVKNWLLGVALDSMAARLDSGGDLKENRRVTLIILAINEDQAISTADRRLTFNGKMKDLGEGKESSTEKGFAVFSEFGRFIVAFTGLAQAGSFSTRKWLMETIVAMSGLTPWQIAERVRDEATKTIEGLALPWELRKLSSAIAGYSFHDDPLPLRVSLLAHISNHAQVQVPGVPPPHGSSPPALGEGFKAELLRPPQGSENAFIVVAVGATKHLPAAELEAIEQLTLERKSAKAIIGRSVHAIRAANDKCELVGRECMGLVLPEDPANPWESGYYSDDDRAIVVHQFGYVEMQNGIAMIHDEPKMWSTKEDGTPIAVGGKRHGSKNQRTAVEIR
ncbi:MAG: hypothetical protein JSU06_06435 [Actinobacteria bacterium]|nr:hypothetical protein [Actinomycetota bacterium]